jgi:Na+/H+ antiporter NhaD/arsenite permease-like protein
MTRLQLFFVCMLIRSLASSVLISSNPTNMVLSGAFSLSFVTYTSSVILPFLAAAVVVYPLFPIVLFRSTELIPPSIELSGGDGEDDGVGIDRPSAALIDKPGAIFGGILLLVTLGVLVGTNVIGVPVWQVTVPPAVLMLGHDAWRDWRCRQVHQVVGGSEHSDASSPSPSHRPVELQPRPFTGSRLGTHRPVHPSRPHMVLSSNLSTWLDRFVRTFPSVHGVCQKLPLSLVPFAFSMFILVQGLASHGWVHVLANWWGAWVSKTGVVGAVAGMMIGSGLLCNVRHSLRLEFSFPLISLSGTLNDHVTADMWNEYWHDHSSSTDATRVGVCL